METFTIIYRANLMRSITKVTARDKQHLIKKLDMLCIREEQIMTIKNVKGELV